MPGVVAAVLALSLLFAAPAQAAEPPPQPGQIVQRAFTNASGTRTYHLFVPTTGTVGKPLMVWLHGCGGALPMQAGHALAKVAQERGFALAYPVQSASANAGSCWNWFDQAHLHRGAGEASIIAGITTSLVAELASDVARVYVGGYSAGGAMSTVMGATYPDVYAAIAPSSGGPYAIDVTGRQAYAEMGPRARPVPAFLVQGLLDELSNYVFGRFNLLQWLGTDDHADDGANNNTVSRLPSGGGLKLPGPGLPIPLVLEDYRSRGCHLAQFVTSPMEHLINGYLISADLGIGLQRLMMDFLLAHRLGGPTQGCG